MFKINHFLLISFFASLINKYCLSLDSCGIYKNTKFEWWGTDCGRFCHQANTEVTCMWFQKHQGCFCKDGFYRDRYWDCVPLAGCGKNIFNLGRTTLSKPMVTMSKECPPNEVWNKCQNGCMNLCESLNNPKKCENLKCTEGCFCKEGMLRNYNGACIKNDLCNKMMGSGSYKYKYSFSMSVSLSLYVKKSYAMKGWKLVTDNKLKQDNSSTTTSTKQTNKQKPVDNIVETQCKVNEEYSTCGDKCSEKCKNMFMSENCPLSCDTGCFCKMDHYRNEKGICIPLQKCSNYKKNKKMTTTTTRKPITTTERPIIPVLRPKKTYITTTTTTTTTAQPVRKVSTNECPENERFDKCASHCLDLCENAFTGMRSKSEKAVKCSPNMNCMEGCFCKEGYYRDLTHKCVPKSQCPPPPTTPKPRAKCKINEQFSECGSKCSESCEIFKGKSEENCPPTCEEGCFCIQGFYKDKYGQCVPQDQCVCELEPQKCKDPKEEYLVCGKNCRETCDITTPECQEACSRGCFCKSGFVYNENGVCVAPNQCGKDIRNGTKAGNRLIVRKSIECPNPNEKWSKCGDQCQDFCKPNFDVKKCKLNCVTGCICKKGFKRNVADQCVEIAKCNDKPVCGENEVYTNCGNACFYRCKDIGHNIQCPLKCTEGCFCRAGFLKDESGKCIAKSQCPRDLTPDCPLNEVYKKCSSRCGETCEDLRSPVECPDECEAGCYCTEGFYRDAEGVCGTKLDCNLPPLRREGKFCGNSEIFRACGNPCEDTCAYNSKCKKTCENGCYCINDYLRNDKGECVHSDLCMGPPQCAVCKPNEYYTSCGTDCGRMCSDIGKKTSCDKQTPCHSGCLCKWGFFRTLDGECVTKNECQVLNEENERDIEYVTTVDPEDVVSPTAPMDTKPGDNKPGENTKPKKRRGRSLTSQDIDKEIDRMLIETNQRMYAPIDPIEFIKQSPTNAQTLSPKGANTTTTKGTSLSPKQVSVSPKRRSVTTGGQKLKPKEGKVSPKGRNISPNGKKLKPMGRKLSPKGRKVTAKKRKLSSNGRRLLPRGRKLKKGKKRSKGKNPKRTKIRAAYDYYKEEFGDEIVMPDNIITVKQKSHPSDYYNFGYDRY